MIKRRRWPRRLALASIVILALVVIAAAGGYGYYKWRFSQIHRVTVEHLRHLNNPLPNAPFNVLMIGSDSRAGLTAAEQQHFGSSQQVQGQRSDVIMILRVDPASHTAAILSIPRDLFVPIAGTGGSNKINSAFDQGPDQLVQTIQNALGIPIDHFMAINFNGFQTMVDAIGGIHMNFPYPAKDQKTGLDITRTGCQLLNGSQALALARSRYFEYLYHGYWNYDGTSDFGRIIRQHQLIKSAIRSAEANIFNPIRMNSFIGAAVHNLTIDSTMTSGELLSFLQDYKSFNSQKLVTYTLPTATVNNYESFGDVLMPLKAQDDQIISSFMGTATTTTTSPTLVTSPGSSPSTSLVPGSTTSSIPPEQPPSFFDPTAC